MIRLATVAAALVLCAMANSPVQALPPIPAPAQVEPIVLTGARIHVGDGQVFSKGFITFAEGKIVAVGAAADLPDTTGHRVIDVSGQAIYPGFILPATRLGLFETESIRATIDSNERGSMNPNVRSLIAYNTDSEIIPSLRFNGILTAEIAPRGGVLAGTSSIVQLDAWNWEDAAVAADVGVHLNWPPRMRSQFNFSTFQVDTVPNAAYEKQISELGTLLKEAQVAHQSDASPENLKVRALVGLISGTQRLLIHANRAGAMVDAVKFALAHEVKHIVLVGAADAWMVTEFLAEHRIPVILGTLHSRPTRADDPVDLPFRLPALLHEAGITVALSYGETSNARNLGFVAGTAAAHGLSKAQALSMITQNPARILGIDKRLGTLEPGKDATLFVSQGDALDMRGNVLTQAFIQGREVVLNARQQELYERYKEKYSR